MSREPIKLPPHSPHCRLPIDDNNPDGEGSLAVRTGSDAVLLMELQSHVNVWLDIAARARGCAEEHQEAGRYDFANWKYEVAGAYELCGKQLQRLLEHPSERQPHPNGRDEGRAGNAQSKQSDQ